MDDLLVLVKGKSASDPQLRAVRKKVQKGTADFNDTAQYSETLSKLIGKNLSANILDIPPDVREELSTELLEYGYTDINELLNDVQISLDEKNGIHIRPQRADFPTERVEQFVHSLIDPTVDDSTIKRRAKAGSETITKSFHDDYMKKNAAFRSDAGLKCYIVRTAAYKCCEWCSNIAGRYPYNVDEMPEDIFRRHDNCDCRTTLENGRERQDVWSKRTWEVPETGPGAESPAVFTEEQAKAIEQRNLQQFRGVKINNSSIDNSGGSGIMRDNKTGIILNTELYQGEVKLYDITQDRINHISDIELSSLSAENNQKLVQGCKELLTYMNDVPLGCEGSIVFNMDMVEIDRYRSEITNSSIPAKTYSSECIVIHNHPSDTLFSDSDLQRFYEHDEYKILGAVGHNGSLYFAEKLPDYDMFGFWDYLEETKRQFPTIMSEEDIVKYVENVMKGAEEYGVKFHTKIYS